MGMVMVVVVITTTVVLMVVMTVVMVHLPNVSNHYKSPQSTTSHRNLRYRKTGAGWRSQSSIDPDPPS
jgi:hypothetical protein